MIKSFPVIVLGMHRSGTSMLANCLIGLGVNMGSKLLEADEGNPNGYFEDVEFLKLNKKIIKASGGEWSYPTSRRSLYKVHSKFKKEMNLLVQDRILENKNGYWGWKDPRNSLTAWMWHVHLSTYYPRYIVIYRNRPDILKSLLERNSDAVNWARLAKVYSEQITSFIRNDNPKIHVCHYEDFVMSKEKAFHELGKIAKFLGMKVSNKTAWKAVEVVKLKDYETI